MQKPPTDNFGYKFCNASIVELYMSASRRIKETNWIGAPGSVSLNHPLKKNNLIIQKTVASKILFNFLL